MYSPKIDEDLIPYLYHLARFLRVPMTKLVSKVLREVLEDLKEKGYGEVFETVARQEEQEKKLLADVSAGLLDAPFLKWRLDVDINETKTP